MQNKQKNLHRCSYEGCTSVFNRPYRLAQHLLVHNNVKAYPCPEKDCTKAYTNKSHLDRHINSVHKVPDNDMLYSCELCLKEFVSLHEKKKHVRSHKTHRCNQCPATFNLWSKYQKHVKNDHLGKEFICNECDRHFKQRSHMVRHVRTHLKIQTRTFPCPYDKCERIYSRNSNLRQHILMKHERITHECQICGAELCTKAKLTMHLKLHSQPVMKSKPPKTKMTGRKERKDLGSLKVSTAHKLAGIPQTYKPEIINVAF
ncbi:transcription factor IIIA-like isoform X2 [Choristoneura fumiferana]|uniref:transcription factor IIIA-like isoform X2 n=1 Tax=Choristoneura fumiferana TaxID=7141 RepID=UPI003D1582D8